jgi:hypothetical protein
MIGGESVPPAMCYYSKLKGGGKCRCCLVEVAKVAKQILDLCKINGFMCDRMHGWNGSDRILTE